MSLKFKSLLAYLLPLCLLLFVFSSCHREKKNDLSKSETNHTPLEKLVAGNARFSHLKPEHPDEDEPRLIEASKEQKPFAVIVSCSDSRVSPELVFDQGVGDLFVIRTAGNMIGDLELGSIEYAVEHLGVKLVVVMGHENCGAVKAFIEGGEAPGHIKAIIDSLTKEAEIKAIPVTDVNRLDDCVKANVQHGIKQLKTQSGIIREKMEKGELQLVSARYDLHDYTVTFNKE